MDLRTMGLDPTVWSILEDMLDFSEEAPEKEKAKSNPSRAYVRDAKAMAMTPADVVEYPNCYVFVVDMPGIKATELKVQVENDNVLVISGERKREKDNNKESSTSGVKYLSMERRVGKFMRKFTLPDNANLDKISAVTQDGVLTVTVEKIPPPQPKRAKSIEVKAS